VCQNMFLGLRIEGDPTLQTRAPEDISGLTQILKKIKIKYAFKRHVFHAHKQNVPSMTSFSFCSLRSRTCNMSPGNTPKDSKVALLSSSASP
jgi:hypothetical protein